MRPGAIRIAYRVSTARDDNDSLARTVYDPRWSGRAWLNAAMTTIALGIVIALLCSP